MVWLEPIREASLTSLYYPIVDPSPLNEMHRNDLSSEPKCLMCMNLNKEPIYPSQGGRDHYYCKSCVKCFLEKTKNCLQCEKEGLSHGNQPIGCMSWVTAKQCSLPGYEDCGIIVISYNFEDGIQGTFTYLLFWQITRQNSYPTRSSLHFFRFLLFNCLS